MAMADSKARIVGRGSRSAARVLRVVGIAAVLVISQAGCSSDSGDAPKYRGTPAGCPQVVAAAKGPIRQFAEELFSEVLEFERPDPRAEADPNRPTMTCKVRYPDRRGSGVSTAVGAPASRGVNLVVIVDTGDHPVDDMRSYLGVAVESAGGRPLAGLGDQAYSGVSPFSGREAAETGFRISNAVVTVSVSGTDITGQAAGQAAVTAPVAFAELEVRATEIARALADDLDGILPH